jgi:UDP-N-acetylmuramate dehydrogenase
LTEESLVENLRERIADLGVEVRLEEPLADYTTVRVGGPARLMAFPVRPSDLAAILKAVRLATQESGLPVEFAVLGGGANVFADSHGFDGLILNMRRCDAQIEWGREGLVVAPGGAAMREVAHEAARRGWGGVAFMAEVPGTIGGAVVINAGTNIGGYVADRLQWVETLTLDGEVHHYEREALGFGYRTSNLLHTPQIVLRAAFQLERLEALGHTPQSMLAHFDAVMTDRSEKFPLDLPNFGSTFRSPGPPFPPAGKMLDELGLKGFQIGAAQISDKHANFIVNRGGATSDDILGLIVHMREAVAARHGVLLRPEVHFLRSRRRPSPDFFPPVGWGGEDA